MTSTLLNNLLVLRLDYLDHFSVCFTLTNNCTQPTRIHFTYSGLDLAISASPGETATTAVQADGARLARATIDEEGNPRLSDLLHLDLIQPVSNEVQPTLEISRSAYSFMLRTCGYRGGLINGVGGAGRSYVYQVLGQALQLPYVWPLDAVSDITTYRDVQGLISSFHIMPTLYSMIQILSYTMLRDITTLVDNNIIAGFHCSRHPLDAWISWYTLDLQLRDMSIHDRQNYLDTGAFVGIARLKEGLDHFLSSNWSHFEAVFQDAPGGNIVGFERYLAADRYFYERSGWRIIKFSQLATSPYSYFQEILAASGFRSRADKLKPTDIQPPRAPVTERWRSLTSPNRDRLLALLDATTRQTIASMGYDL